MTEPVSQPYKLPPEVLARLGNDATPDEAIKAADRGTATYVDNLKQPDGDDNDARFAWYGMLAAAAIRECEAVRNHADAKHACDLALLDAAPEEMSTLAAERDAAAKEEREATAQYDALRHWRNRR